VAHHPVGRDYEFGFFQRFSDWRSIHSPSCTTRTGQITPRLFLLQNLSIDRTIAAADESRNDEETNDKPYAAAEDPG